MNKQKLLSNMIYELLTDGEAIPKSTAESFRKLYAHCESNKPLSKYLIQKFELLGLYDHKENKITHPEDQYGIILQAMVFCGLLKSKCPNGKVRSLETYKEQKILSSLVVYRKQRRALT